MSRVNLQRSTSIARPHSHPLKKPLAQAISTFWLASVMIGGACAAEGETVAAVEVGQETGQSEQEASQLDAVVVTAQNAHKN